MERSGKASESGLFEMFETSGRSDKAEDTFEKEPAPKSGILTPRGRNLDTPRGQVPEHDPNLFQPIGKGAFGVLQLRADSNGSQFVLKSIDVSAAAHQAHGRSVKAKQVAEQMEIAKVELKALQRIGEYPHVVRLIGSQERKDSKTEHQFLDIALGHVMGETLAHYQGELDDKHASHVMQQLLKTLDYCHQKGVAHMDIKPQNMIVNSRGKITLLDFGGARVFDPKNPVLKDDEISQGSPGFRHQDIGTDVTKIDTYSAGKTCEKLLKKPISKEAERFIQRCLRQEPIEALLKDSWLG